MRHFHTKKIRRKKMARWRTCSGILILLAFVATIGLAGISIAKQRTSIGKDAQWYQWHPAENWSYKDPGKVKEKFHAKGKTSGMVFPTEAIFGQIFVDVSDGREWIFDGMQFVPHDDSVEDYYATLATIKKTPPNMTCTPTGGTAGVQP
jgi:hypothetical protein